MRLFSVRAGLLTGVLLLSTPALAQGVLTGPLSDATTGPLGPGVHEAQSISVPAGETLTVAAGAIIKFGFDGSLTVEGTLRVQGTSVDPVIFTDRRDDVGGDTNGDGAATVPGAGWWRGLQLDDTADASVVEHAIVRFGGRFISGVELLDCDATFSDVEVSDCTSSGFDLNGTSLPGLSGCNVERCTSVPFDAVPIAAVPGFSGLSASDNLSGDRVRVSVGTVPAGTLVSLGPGNGLSGALDISSSISVPVGSTLELAAGTVLKMRFDGGLRVDGTLRALGTPGNPVVVTDERDDTVAGDTNGDGAASAPGAGWWRGITLTGGADASLFQHVELRYGGRFIAGFELDGADATFTDVVVRDFTNSGFDLGGTSEPTIAGAHVERCTGTAFERVRIHALERFSGLSAENNGKNWVDVTDGNVLAGESLSIGPENGVHGGFRVGGNVFVASGGSLELRAGTIVKVRFDGAIDAEGNLDVRGTQSAPILMVDERDDVGGDSNADGSATLPAQSWWRGMRLGVDATGSEFEWLDLAHGGRFRAGIVVDAVGARFDHCRVRDNSTGGIDLAGTSAPCEFVACTVQDCTGNAIDRVRLDRVGDFRRTVVSGAQNNRLRVTNGTLAADTTLAAENLVGGALFIDAPVAVPDGFTLTLERGVVLQMAFDRVIDVAGALIVDASFELPAIITSESDTTVVGGSTPGTFNWWRGITFDGPNGASDVRGLIVRNGGRFVPNVNVIQGSVSLREVRSERSGRSGFNFDVAPLVSERLAAVDNIGPGFELDASTGDLRQATALGNNGAGFDASPAYTGTIRDSISWGNLGVAFDVPSGSVEFSNGDAALAGANGNIFADPLFVDEAARDLRLLPGSPSLDAGSPLSPLDPDGSPADQGAYPRNDLLPEVFCPQADDAFCEPSIVTLGFASLSSPEPFIVSLVDAPTDAIGLFFYGRGARTQLTGLFGNICVTDPYYRTPVIASGGDPARGPCDGRFEFDAREYLASGIDAGIAPGVTLIGAFWHRDATAPGGAKFTEAVEIPIGN